MRSTEPQYVVPLGPKAGIVDVTTKSGDTLNHNELSLYGGSYDTFQPSAQVGGTDGRLDYFVTTSYNHNGLGILIFPRFSIFAVSVLMAAILVVRPWGLLGRPLK